MDTISNMQDKVILLTGGTRGIGRVTAEALARAGANLTITGRDAERTQAVVHQIREKTGNTRVDALIGDLSIQSEVRRMAAEFLQGHDRLDVLINNAGAVFMHHAVTADGIEMTFALNHLAYFLMTNLLLDLLKASAPARIVNVSSAAHMGGRVNFEDLKDPRHYNGWKAYSQSKLANIYFTYELARRLQGTGVTVNALHPGFVATNFGKSNGGFFKPLFRLAQIAAITPEQGAKTSIYLATSPEVEGVSGKYFDALRAVSSSHVSYDQEAAGKLWEASLLMTGMREKV